MSEIVNFVLGLVAQFVDFLLSPIEWLISGMGLEITNYLGKVWDFIALICQNLLWVMNALAIPPLLVGIILAYFIFRGTLFLIVYGVKVFMKWWGILW